MSYCVFITRRMLSDKATARDITLDEWSAIADSDRELVFDLDRVSATWNGVSSRSSPTFEWHDGEIVAHNPDTAQLTKMRELAGRLDARVVTEDGCEINETGGEDFTPATAYDYDFAAARKMAHQTVFGGLRGVLLYHYEIVPAIIGLVLVTVRIAFFRWQWIDCVIASLAGSMLGFHVYYRFQQRQADQFNDWLLRNVEGVAVGTANYRGLPVTLDTQVTRYQGAYSFVFSANEWSRWYRVGSDDQKGKWIHSTISILFGGWGLPLGPLETVMALLINLAKPGGDRLTVRNLCLRLDDRLCHIVGGPDK